MHFSIISDAYFQKFGKLSLVCNCVC